MFHTDTSQVVQSIQEKEIPAELASPGRLPRFFAVVGYAVCSLLVLATLLELVCWAGWYAYHRVRPTFPELRAASPVYVNKSWGPEFWQEEHSRLKLHTPYSPFTLWAVPAFHSTYINNDEGQNGVWRRTINPLSTTCDSKDKLTVWTFGASTLYGTGVPDWATIPSYLARILTARTGACAVVSNFGVEGYVSNQEVLQLLHQLKMLPCPDIVIFYDGVNDAAAAGTSPGPPSPHFDFETVKDRLEGSITGRLDFIRNSYSALSVGAMLRWVHPQPSAMLGPEYLRAKGNAALDNYEANLQIAEHLSEAFGFDLYCFWQPSLYYGHKPLARFETQVLEFMNNDENRDWSRVIRAVFEEVQRRAARDRNFVFMGDLFNSDAEPLYIDEAHLGPQGNEKVAQFLAEYIETHSKSYVDRARRESMSHIWTEPHLRVMESAP